MKRYTGNLVLELEDVNTGVVETVSETNMVTNAVNDILGVNPMGVMYKAGGQYDDSLTWNEELLPICPNMIGGILLFPSSITEQADNLYLPSTNLPVAYASNDVNATANTKRGSMNLTESMKLSDGFKFVWEFTPSQGNGTIAAVGLTSKHGGANAYGSEVAVDSTLLQIKKVSLDDGDGFINDLFRSAAPSISTEAIRRMESLWMAAMGTGMDLPIREIPPAAQRCSGSRSGRATIHLRKVSGRFPMQR